MTTAPDFVLVRETTLVTDAQVAACAEALTVQLQQHAGPAWGVGGTVRAGAAVAGSWAIHLRDHSDQQGALGYHDNAGAPVGFVFVADDQRYGLSWTVTASHELLEMAGDPECAAGCQVSSSKWAARELCDPVEADALGYTIPTSSGPVAVSDFLLPAWYNPRTPKGTKVDYMGRLSAPLTLAPGGYASIWTSRTGWRQVTAETAPGAGISARAARARRWRTRAARDAELLDGLRVDWTATA